MSAAHHPHWAELGETTSVAGVRLLCGVYHLLGRWPFRLCLAPVVLAHWLGNRTARHASLDYLQRLQRHAGVFAGQPGWRESLRHFGCFAETLLDKLLAAGQRYPQERIRLVREHVLALIRQGRGGLIVTAHLGCLELCQALAECVPGLRLTVLVHTAHAQRINGLIRRLAPQASVELVQVTDMGPGMAMQLAERIAAGEFVAIAGDRVPLQGGRSVRVPFLGTQAPFPIGAWVLGAALGCPVFTMACIHHGDGYEVRLEPFAERIVLPRGAREAALVEQAVRFAGWLERQVRDSPYDWFNFYPFWDQATNEHRA